MRTHVHSSRPLFVFIYIMKGMAKIPSEAKRVFRGVIFDVYQWPQQMFDGTTATFEMLKRQDTATIIGITEDGQIITVLDEQPAHAQRIMFPAGRLHEDEDALKGAKREFVEETGYTSDDWELWQAFDGGSEMEVTFSYFVARNCRKTAPQTLDPGGEKVELRLMSLDGVLDDIISGRQQAWSIGTHIMQQLLLGKRAELEKFLSNHKK